MTDDIDRCFPQRADAHSPVLIRLAHQSEKPETVCKEEDMEISEKRQKIWI